MIVEKDRTQTHRTSRKWIVRILLALLLTGLAGTVGSYRLTTGRYTLHTPKLRAPVRLLLIADLHSCRYGKRQEKIIRAIEAERPDALMFCGDIADDKLPHENAKLVIDALAKRYPSFYVTGNHEYWSGEADALKESFRRSGATILEGAHTLLTIRDERLTVCGIDDPESGRFAEQLTTAAKGIDAARYTILLAHRPEAFPQYAAHGFDLVLSGHAHGGLWRVPWILKGFAAPNQGFFPKYTSGIYEEGNTAMVVSRGLARESTRIPRLFNTVELVVVDILPATAANP
jgi:Predicted phosphohydrolases